MRRPSYIASFALLFVVGCGVEATNPFDPETPRDVQAKSRLSGTVLGRTADGTTPLLGATVTLEGDSTVAPVTTDADGAFLVADIVPGTWTVVVTHPTHLSQLRSLPLAPGFEKVVEVVLDPLPQTPTDDAARITGHALKSGELARPEAERDHSGIVVEVEGAGIRTVTAPDGAFDLFLQPGTYNLVFSARNYNLLRKNGITVAAKQTVTVPDDPVVLDANPGSASGRVTLEGLAGSAGLDGVAVTIAGAGTTQTAPDGSWRITGLAAGNYAVQFTRDGYDTLTVIGVNVEGGRETVVPEQRLAVSRGAIRGVARFSDRSDHSGIAITLGGTAYAVATTPAGAFVFERIPVGTYELVASSNGYTRAQAATVLVNANGVTEVPDLTLVRQQGDFEIDRGAAWTRDREVTLTLVVPGAASMRVSEDPTFQDATLGDTAYGPFTAAPTFELTEGDGEKVVFVQTRDGAGSESAVLEGRIVLDSTPPTGTTVVIDGGAAWSRDAAGRVSLALGASDALSGVQAIQLSNDATFDEPFSPFATSLTHVLADPTVDGVRTVYVRFRDGAGNVTPAATEASITLDRTPPALARFSVDCDGRSGATWCRSSLVTLSIEATGAARMLVSNTAGFPGDVQEPFAATRAWLLEPGDGLRTVHLQLVDAAGNRSAATSDDVQVDGQAPTSPFVRIDEGAQVRTLEVHATLGAVGADEMRLDLRDADGGRTEGTWVAFSPATSVTLPAGPDGTRRVEVQFRDLAGNTSDLASTTVTVDRTAPQDGTLSFDATTVRSTTQTARLDALGATRMRIATDGALDTEAWVTFARSAPVVLASGDGEKLVLAAFRDDAGNESAPVEARLVLDTVAPTGAITLAGGAEAVNTPLVTVAFSGVSSDVVEMQLSDDASFTGATWVTYTANTSWTLPSTEGARTLHARFRDVAGNVSAPASDTVTLDRSAPTAGTVTITPAGHTRVAAVTLAITGAGATRMRVDVIDADGSRTTGAWEALATTKALTLPTTLQGTKRVEVAFKDDAGNEGPVASAQVTYDTVAPTGLTVAVAEGDFVATRSVTLALDATGADEMQVAVDGTADTEAWQAFARTLAVTLPATDGAKTVAVRVRDFAGNSPAPVTATTTLDTGVPTGTIELAGGATAVSSALVAVAFGSVSTDVIQMQLATDAAFTGAAWVPYAANTSWTFSSTDGSKTLHARFRDAAGNTSAAVNDSVTLDRTPPAAGTVAISPSGHTRDANVTLAITGSGATEMRIDVVDADATRTTGAWEAFATTKAIALPDTRQGLKRVEVSFRDAAGNVGPVASAQVTYDTVAPTGLTVAIAEGANVATRNVTLAIDASGADEMQVAVDGTADAEPWQVFAKTLAVVLPATDGTKTVAVRVRDFAGNSLGPVTATTALDTGVPAGSVTLANGAAAVNAALVSVAFSSVSSDVVQMQLATDSAFTGAAWVPYAADTSWTFSSTDGVKTLYARFRDPAGNVSSAVNDTVTLDRTPPSAGTVAISPAGHTRLADVTLAITGSGATQMRIDVVDADGTRTTGTWETFATTRALTLPSTQQGAKRVDVAFRDAALNEGPVASALVTYDTVAPTALTVAIDEGDHVPTRDVTLALDASGADEMQVAVDGTADTEAWQSFAKTLDVTLPATDGTKTVAVRVRDFAGNSLGPVTATTTLDTGTPTGTVELAGGAAATNNPLVTVAFASVSTDVVEMQLATDSAFTGAAWVAYAAVTSWTFSTTDGTKTLYARFRDSAGNTSAATSDAITLDRTAPTAGTVAITPAGFTRVAAVTLAITGAGATQMRIDVIDADGTRTTGSWETFATTKALTLPTTQQGLKRVDVAFRDAALNEGPVASAQVLYDTVAPTGVAVAITEGARVATRNVTLELDATGADEMQVAVDGAADSEPWQAFATTLAVTLPATDGTKTVAVRVRDFAGNAAGPATASAVLDTGAPSGTIELAGGAAATNNPLVTVTLGSVSSDVTEMQLATDSAFTGASWAAFVPSTSWTFPSTDGEKKLFARFRDGAGNTSPAVDDSIVLDRTAPTAGTVAIAPSGYTRLAAVTLTITGSGATQMRIDVIDADGSRSTGTWETFATTKALTLPSTQQGLKRVDVAFRDDALNEGPVASAQVTYDTVAPTGLTVAISEGANIASRNVNLVLDATGADEMQVAVDGTADAEPWQAFSRALAVTLPTTDGAKTVAVRVRDFAGNSLGPVTASTTLDTVAPTGTITIAGGATYTTSVLVTATLSGTSADATELQLSNDSGFTGATWQPVATSVPWTLSGGDGSKTVYVRFRDRAGNTGASASDGITLDATAPTSPTLSLPAFVRATPVAATVAATGADEMKLSVIDVDGTRTEGSWVTYATAPSVTIPTVQQGTKRIEAVFRDLAGNLTAPVLASFVFDNVAPTSPSVSIAAGATWTTDATVTLTLTAGGATEMRVAADGVYDTETWEPYLPSKVVTLPSTTDGSKTVRATFRDDALNTTASVSDTITLDTSAPTGSISINGGAASTNSTYLVLTLTRGDTNTSDVQVSDDAAFAGAVWQPFAATIALVVNAGEGTRTVYARFRDAAGNVSSSTYSDTITMDTTGPTSPDLSFTEGTDTNSSTVELVPSAVGAVEMNIANRPNFETDPSATGWIPVTSRKAWVLDTGLGDGTKDVYVKYRDSLGNESETAVASIVLDTTAPVVTLFRLADGDAFVTNRTVSVDLTAFDALTGVTSMYVSRNGTFTDGAWVAFDEAFTFDLKGSVVTTTTTFQPSVKVRDAVGNESLAVDDRIVVDVDVPVVTSVAWVDNATTTDSTSVKIDITASDQSPGALTSMQISETSSFTGIPWISYASSYQGTLSSTNGNRTVWVRVRDAAGRESVAVESPVILLDTLAPTITAAAFVEGEASKSTTVRLVVTAGDNLATGTNLKLGWSASTSTCASMSYTSSFTGCTDQSCTATFTVSLTAGADGSRSIFTCVRDAANNYSKSERVSISLDATNPTTPTGLVTTGTSRQVLASWSASTDDTAGVRGYVVRYTENGVSTTLPETTATTLVIDELLNRRQYDVEVQAVDVAGNKSPFTATVSAITGFGAGRHRQPWTRSWADGRASVVAGGGWWTTFRSATNRLELMHCDVARDDCRQPDSWTRLNGTSSFVSLASSRTISSTPAIAATNDRIYVFYFHKVAADSTLPTVAFRSCAFRTADCTLSSNWANTTLDSSGEASTYEITADAAGSRIFVAYYRTAAAVDYPTVAQCHDGRDCTDPAQWTVVRIDTTAGPARGYAFQPGMSFAFSDTQLYLAYGAYNATSAYGIGLMYCPLSSACDSSGEFLQALVYDANTSAGRPKLLRSREAMYLVTNSGAGSSQTIVAGKCSLTTDLCDSADDWTFDTLNDLVPTTEIRSEDVYFAAANQGGTAMHIAYWVGETGRLRFATCDLPETTDCTNSANWRRLTLDNFVALDTRPTLALFGSQALITYLDQTGYLKTFGPRFATPADFGAVPGPGAFRASWTAPLYVDGYDVRYNDTLDSAPTNVAPYADPLVDSSIVSLDATGRYEVTLRPVKGGEDGDDTRIARVAPFKDATIATFDTADYNCIIGSATATCGPYAVAESGGRYFAAVKADGSNELRVYTCAAPSDCTSSSNWSLVTLTNPLAGPSFSHIGIHAGTSLVVVTAFTSVGSVYAASCQLSTGCSTGLNWVHPYQVVASGWSGPMQLASGNGRIWLGGTRYVVTTQTPTLLACTESTLCNAVGDWTTTVMSTSVTDQVAAWTTVGTTPTSVFVLREVDDTLRRGQCTFASGCDASTDFSWHTIRSNMGFTSMPGRTRLAPNQSGARTFATRANGRLLVGVCSDSNSLGCDLPDEWNLLDLGGADDTNGFAVDLRKSATGNETWVTWQSLDETWLAYCGADCSVRESWMVAPSFRNVNLREAYLGATFFGLTSASPPKLYLLYVDDRASTFSHQLKLVLDGEFSATD